MHGWLHMDVPVALGEVLLGKYRVERILGQGGMGVVVAVRHVELDQLSAMKFLLPTANGHEASRERFLREAKAAARLKSDHVAKVQDVGRMENGASYMLMEYLEGCDLKALVAQHGALPVEDTVTYVLQVCEAMVEAHAAGMVHRDLKPANLFLMHRRDGRPYIKVLDFGISKQLVPQGVDLTNTNEALGSPLYMSPEQMEKSKTVDERTDIWALGVILYELLAGTSPFRGSSILDVASRVLKEEPMPLHALRRDIPSDLESVVAKCMRKCRDERFQSVEELQTELFRFVSPGTIARQHVSLMTNQPAVLTDSNRTGETTTTTFRRTGKPLLVLQERRPILWAFLGAGLVLVIGGGMAMGWPIHEPSADGVEPVVSVVLSPIASVGAPPLPEAAFPGPEEPDPPSTPPPESTTTLRTTGPTRTSSATTRTTGLVNNSPF